MSSPPRRTRPLAGSSVKAPSHRRDARFEFTRAERLGQVVVGAEFPPQHAVGLAAVRGEHDDRPTRAPAVVLEQVQPVAVRQHQVKQHQVVVVLRQQGKAVGAGMSQREQAVIGIEVFAQHLCKLDVGVDQQDAVRHR
ncbi:hypothetical protein G6F46_014504 [Rhizopus delemar]|nr:hypothetical protein G6F46_014504 [Rhizopus delemar]